MLTRELAREILSVLIVCAIFVHFGRVITEEWRRK